MTDEELGCYVRLILAQFNRGGTLPNDLKFLSRYCDSLERSWPVVGEKFKEIGGQLQNERMEIERVKSYEYSKSRKENREKGKDIKNISTTYVKHMGNGKGNGILVLRGTEFFENNSKVKFEDGSWQELGETQLFMLSQNQLRPRDVYKGNSY